MAAILTARLRAVKAGQVRAGQALPCQAAGRTSLVSLDPHQKERPGREGNVDSRASAVDSTRQTRSVCSGRRYGRGRGLTDRLPRLADEPASQAALNLAPLPFFVHRDKRHRLAGAAHAASPSNAVGEQLLRVGQVVVDNLADTFEVQASGGHVGCHQNRRGTGTKTPSSPARARSGLDCLGAPLPGSPRNRVAGPAV